MNPNTEATAGKATGSGGMNPVLSNDRAALFVGDSNQLPGLLGANAVDAVLTDPPYELGFMGKRWDASGIAFSVEFWRGVLEVLKPGGHLLAFGGTRTYHRMTCAIEDAGFEIRDSLHWFYGTGFPKSLDVSKAFDAAAGATREIIRVKGTKAAGLGDGGYTTRIPDVETAPSTDLAKQWAGWGTALKPGHEPIVLARKPLAGTVAANVLAHGTGALNIDACRIGTSKRVPGSVSRNGQWFGANGETGNESGHDPNVGRWPANVLLDEDAAAELDAQTGDLKAGGAIGAHTAAAAITDGRTVYSNHNAPRGEWKPHGDSGGASRFFYVAKPGRSERDLGCEHLAPKSAGEMTDREDGSDGLNSPRAGAGRTGGARNHHPTVKPVTLLRYLARLITPPGGLILDPFTGSGSTGVAALAEGFEFLGVELTPEYAEIAKARLEHALKQPAKAA